MKIEIYPLDRISIDGQPICLGMEQSCVEATIGKGQFIRNRCYYFDNELAIDYDHNNKVEFIECLSGIDGVLKPYIYGMSAFESSANDLLKLLQSHNNGMIDNTENGYSYQFNDISVGVYREAVPEEVMKMIKEAEDFGDPMSDDDINYEMNKSNHWATIGFGIANYYKNK